MPQIHTYNLFISHSWSYDEQYKGLCSLLNSHKYFEWKDYSVPESDPIQHASNDKELKGAIKNQMIHASVIIIVAGVYATYSKWMNIELELAKELNKPIIAVEPWGSARTSDPAKASATEVVGWNSDSIINKIRELTHE